MVPLPRETGGSTDVRHRRDHQPRRRAPDRVGDDPHAAVDEAPRARLDRLRALRAAVRGLGHARQAGRRQHPARLRVRGPAAPQQGGDRAPARRARRDRALDRRTRRSTPSRPTSLRRRPQGAGRPRRGRARGGGALARALAADRQGPRRRRVGVAPVPARPAGRQPRHRPRAHGHRVRRRHLRRPPLLGLSVLGHRRGPQRAADRTTTSGAAGSSAAGTASSPSATRRSSPSTSPSGWRRARTSRAPCASRSTSSTACSPTCA